MVKNKMTMLQEAAYNAQLAAGLPISELARVVLTKGDRTIDYRHCATYINSICHAEWFQAAFPGRAGPVTVIGGKGNSHADATQRLVKIGSDDRLSVGKCEQACLHELAHIVTPDYGPGNYLREPAYGTASSMGHHYAWRANFILIVRKTLGRQAAQRLRQEFWQWGLPTRK